MSLPIEEWGPTCARCGSDEYRIDGYCTIECRDFAELEAELAQLRAQLDELLAAVEENERDIKERDDYWHGSTAKVWDTARRIREARNG